MPSEKKTQDPLRKTSTDCVWDGDDMRRLLASNMALCLICGGLFALPTCWRWDCFMDDMDHGRTVLVNYSLGLELLIGFVTVITSIVVNGRLLRAERSSPHNTAAMIAIPTATLLFSAGLGLLIGRGFILSYTLWLH